MSILLSIQHPNANWLKCLVYRTTINQVKPLTTVQQYFEKLLSSSSEGLLISPYRIAYATGAKTSPNALVVLALSAVMC